ncbi:MAG: hypothetical protein IIT58_09970 [Treponema sp.]|nr:hypothetical protein [Treponema sp.]
MSNYQKKFKDRLFTFIFGRDSEQSKRWRLDLYNALNGTHYTDPDALKINTIENVIYISMHNDVSFIVDNEMNLYEQQSSFNPNMPLRGLLYFSQLYNAHIKSRGENILSSRKIMLPTPKYVVFYNGLKEAQETWKMRLSDSFKKNPEPGDFEWTATAININRDHNKELQKNCKPLYDYISFVAKTRENLFSGTHKQEAFEKAVDWAINQNLLEGLFKKYRAEVLDMILTEYDEDFNNKTWYEDGVEDGILKGKLEDAEKLLKMKILSLEQISEVTNLSIEQIQELQNKGVLNA